MKASDLSAPSFISWQLTRDCNLACLHCCTDSAPGRKMPGELSRQEALDLARRIAAAQVPYVMIAGGEPTIVGHFLEVAKVLGRSGVCLKIETNGQAFGEKEARVLSRLPVRSVQISLDGAAEKTYAKMRPGGSLEKALSSCRLARSFGLPLEITFAPTKLNIDEAGAVVELALSLGAFRFNTGRLMRLGTAAKLWDRLALLGERDEKFYNWLVLEETRLQGRMEMAFRPFSVEEEIRSRGGDCPATLLVLPDGRVKVSAFLPHVCADLRRQSLAQAWRSYQEAWRDPEITRGFRDILEEERSLDVAHQAVDMNLPVLV